METEVFKTAVPEANWLDAEIARWEAENPEGLWPNGVHPKRDCLRCSHHWEQRLHHRQRPAQCPNCKSTRWDVPPRKKKGALDPHNIFFSTKQTKAFRKSRKEPPPDWASYLGWVDTASIKELGRELEYPLRYCYRCGHRWHQRLDALRRPRECPNCRSREWFKPSVEDVLTWKASPIQPPAEFREPS